MNPLGPVFAIVFAPFGPVFSFVSALLGHRPAKDEHRRPKPIDVDPVYEIIPDDDDDAFAEDLQLQEIIRYTSNNNNNSKPSSSGSRSLCGICWNTGCTHSVSIERSRGGADQTFRVAITGDFDGEALTNLVNAIYDAAHGLAGEKEKGKGKGKEKVEFRESSPLPIVIEEEEEEEVAAPEFDCGICMETLPIAESFGIENCSHIFCAECVGSYIAAKVEENVIYIRCPDPECREGSLEPELCRWIIRREVFDRWGLALCEAAVGAEKFYCPYKECSGLLIDDGDAITDVECPHCLRIFCAQCRVPWHEGLTCKEYQNLGEDERGKEDLMLRRLAANKKWQRCPKCKMFVERIDGCMFMTCRCGYCFCYTCASPMSTTNHYCAKCKR